jgi:predicted AAA+ superfamily ATPase
MLRVGLLDAINESFRTFQVTALLGPRQVGKTTLAREYIKNLGGISPANYFDLEDPLALQRLENPRLAMGELEGLVVIDEIQRRPDLFPILRVLVDENKSRKFLVLGSSSVDLLRQSSETLAGRINYIEVAPFSLSEVGHEHLKSLWIRGGYPRAFLADNDDQANKWLRAYTATFLERDIPQLGLRLASESMRRLWMILVHYHGQLIKYSEIGTSLGLSDKTIRGYIDVLIGTFMLRLLRPWSANIGKREVKTPKLFFRDTGIFHSLLGVSNYDELLVHPRLGASWEGFALATIINELQASPDECYYWGVHGQGELDLLVQKRGKIYGFEIKYSDAPKLSEFSLAIPKMLNLTAHYVVYPGAINYRINPTTEVIALTSVSEASLHLR